MKRFGRIICILVALTYISTFCTFAIAENTIPSSPASDTTPSAVTGGTTSSAVTGGTTSSAVTGGTTSSAVTGNTVQPAPAFSDVPKTSIAYDAIHELRRLGVTDGEGNNKFGFGKNITRGEFVTFLVKLMGWKPVTPAKATFSDNRDTKKNYYIPIETALSNGVITKGDGKFRPNTAITREEAAVMLVNALGYNSLAERLRYLNKPYPDVNNNIGHIVMARDFGLISGTSAAFNPKGKVLKEQAAIMLIKLREGLNRPLKDLNAFYAISSTSQQDKIPDLTSVSFGWSSLGYDPATGTIMINTSRNAGANDYYLPVGFSQRLQSARQAGIPALLMLQSTQDNKITDPGTGLRVGIPEYVLTRPDVYKKLIGDIISSVNGLALGNETGTFDGVVIDIEGLKGAKLKQCFNDFLKELRTALNQNQKKLYVAVHPVIHAKRSATSVDGYDYKTIGALSDKVILMAHDYDAKRLTQADMARGFNITPLTPIEDVYYALQAITDKTSGVQDRSKIMLQFSFDWTVWHRKGGKTLNAVPDSFNLNNFIALLNSGTPITYQYAKEYESPYIKYTDAKSGAENTVWYENTSSIKAKIKLAKLFGIQGISLWRLGLIPDYLPEDGRKLEMDVWQNIMKEMGKK